MNNRLDMQSPEFRELMGQYIGGTEITAAEVFLIGFRLLSWVNVTSVLGHTTPGESLSYIAPDMGDIGAVVVHDFVRWTARNEGSRDAGARLRAHVFDSGFAHMAMASLESFVQEAS